MTSLRDFDKLLASHRKYWFFTYLIRAQNIEHILCNETFPAFIVSKQTKSKRKDTEGVKLAFEALQNEHEQELQNSQK